MTIVIQAPDKKQSYQIDCDEKETILDALIRQGIQYPADCGGRGTCGKCKIKILESIEKSMIDISVMDRKIFSKEELEQGYRLACQTHLKGDTTIILSANQDITGFEVIADNKLLNNLETSDKLMDRNNQELHYSIAIDLGTTTIAVSLFDHKQNRILHTNTFVNHQRIYGADVIARIKASNEGKREALRDIIREQILKGIIQVIAAAKIRAGMIDKIAIAGNTTMLHLFLGYSCETLGVYPFTPVKLGLIQQNFREIFSQKLIDSYMASDQYEEELKQNINKMIEETIVCFLPGISAFVGGDITAGLYACGFDQAEKTCLLIDLGTNGEMAIGNRDHILVTSAAAGPAFEGGNLSCGVGSVPGAISHIVIKGDKVNYQTIGDKPAIGICGTGAIDLAAELLKLHIIDETGLLAGDYFDKGYIIGEIHNQDDLEKTVGIAKIVVTQKDIRELQLAKAAIRAGIEILLKQYHISFEQLDTVYLAGGFGYKMDSSKAVEIGLFPRELHHKIKAIGNSSLAGANGFLTDNNSENRINQIISLSKEIHLAKNPDFQDLFIQYMNFQ